MSRGSQVMRVTGQLTDGSRGSRVKKCDPLSSLVRVRVMTGVSEPNNFTRPTAIQYMQVDISRRKYCSTYDFFGFPKVKWLHLAGEVNKCVRCSCQILSGFNIPKIIKIGQL